LKKHLSIIIFDGSLKTTPFINRLAAGLAQKHKVYIMGFDHHLQKPIPKVNYIRLGSATQSLKLFWVTLGWALNGLFKSGSFKGVQQLLKGLGTRNKKSLQHYNFNRAIQYLQPDILHVQWPSLLPWCEGLLQKELPNIILSQRGFQNNVRPFVDPENKAYLQKIYPQLDGFHSVSKAMEAKGNQIHNDPSQVKRVVYSGFDLAQLPYEDPQPVPAPLQLLSVGRPHWIKNYPLALKACALLKQQNIPFQYTIIGAKGNEELQYLVRMLGLEEEVQLTARVSQKEVYERMRAATVLLLPSLAEGMPNVALEAMALGVPVVSSNSGGINEMIIHQKTGWLVSSQDPKEMAQVMSELPQLAHKELINITQAARKKIEVEATTQTMVQGMESLYTEVCNRDR